MDQHIKPIETQYNGYRFRSRLEARWAVFFDTLSVKYEYEPNTFQVSHSGLTYLPDFYMPIWDKFVEIKPQAPLDQTDVLKWGGLVQYQGKPILVIFGQPWPGEYSILSAFPSVTPGEYAPHQVCWPKIRNRGHFAYGFGSQQVYLTSFDAYDISLLPKEEQDRFFKQRALLHIPLFWEVSILADGNFFLAIDERKGSMAADYEQGIECLIGSFASLDNEGDSPLVRAYIAARQARFEWGESGAPKRKPGRGPQLPRSQRK
jgi:hypothetical protein